MDDAQISAVDKDTPLEKTHSNSELDLTEHWANVSVAEQVLKGDILRQKKPSAYEESEYDVINIAYERPIRRKCSVKRESKSCEACKLRPKCTIHPFLRKNLPPSLYDNITSSSLPKRKRNRKKVDRCSLRVAELAEPSKRQCMETWQTRGHTLPAEMVENLRKIIRNEKPTVQIHEAIRCFKSKNCCKSRRSSEGQKHVRRSFKAETEIKYFSAIFGHKINKKLQLPITISPIPWELEKLSEVIEDEISDILQGHKAQRNKKMLSDVSRKIAIWIALILDDTDEKLLTDELKELEETEGPVLDILDQIFDSVTHISDSETDDNQPESDSNVDKHSLSDEDTTKDLAQYIIDQSIKEAIADDEHTIQSETESTSEDIANYIIDHSLKEVIPVPSTADIDHPENVTNYLLDILINSLQPEEDALNKNASDGVTMGDGNDDSIDEKFEDSLQGNLEEHVENPAVNDNEQKSVTNISDIHNENEDPDNPTKLDSVTEKEYDDSTKPSNANTDDDVNELMDISTTEVMKSDTEVSNDNTKSELKNQNTEIENNSQNDQINEEFKKDDNKTVEEVYKIKNPQDSSNSISKQDYNGYFKADLKLNNASETSIILENSSRNITWNPSDTIHNIEIGPVNLNLLSDADEGWPPVLPHLRPSSSVSKSITSLGKLLEVDEKGYYDNDTIEQILKENTTNTSDQDKEQMTKLSRPERVLSVTQFDLEYDADNVNNLAEPSKDRPIGEDIKQETGDNGDKRTTEDTGSSSRSKSKLDDTIFLKEPVPYEVSELQTEELEETIRASKPAISSTVKLTSADDNLNNERGQKEDIGKIKLIKHKAVSDRQRDAKKHDTIPKCNGKYNYKIDMKTAPEWVKERLLNYTDQSSGDSLFNTSRTKKSVPINENKTRLWMDELQTALESFENCNREIGLFCEQITYLKTLDVNDNPSGKTRTMKWVKLKQQMNHDINQWGRMHSYIYNRMKKYAPKSVVPTECYCQCRKEKTA